MTERRKGERRATWPYYTRWTGDGMALIANERVADRRQAKTPVEDAMNKPKTSETVDKYFTELCDQAYADPVNVSWQAVARLMFARASELELALSQARSEERERCAKECEELAAMEHKWQMYDRQGALKCAAAAIRALED